MGHRGPLQWADVCKLYNKESLQNLCCVFEHEFNKQHSYCERHDFEGSGRNVPPLSSETSGYSVLHTLWKTFRPAIIKVALLRLWTDLLSILVLLTLRWVILFCERQAVFDWAGYTYSLVVLVAVCCSAVSHRQFERQSGIMMANVQAVVTGALYRKTFSFSCSSRRQSSVSDVAPLRSGDAECLGGLVVPLACIWSPPLRAAVYLGLLWRELGSGVLVGLLGLAVLIPVSSAVQSKVKQLQKTLQILRENTKQLVKEMMQKFQALKLLAWEPWFCQRVKESRSRELEVLRILGYLSGFSMLDFVCMPFLVLFSCLAVFVLVDDGNVLTASQIFTALFVFRLLRPALLEIHWEYCSLKHVLQSLRNLEKVFLTKGRSQLGTTKGSVDELLPDSSQEQYDRYKDDKQRDSEEQHHNQCQSSSGEAFRLYLRAFGWHWVTAVSLIHLGVCVGCIAHDAVLSVWTGEAKEVQGLEGWRELRNSRLSAYGLLGLLQALLVCCYVYCQTCGSVRASDALHCELLSDVLHRPVCAAQTTDARRLLHTLTHDLQVVDEELPKHLHSWLRSVLEMLTTIAVLIFILPVFSLAVCPLTFLFLHIQSRFSAHMKMRNVSSQESVEAPVSESEEVCVKLCLQALNQNLLIKYNRIVTQSWFALRLDIIAGILLFLVCLIALETQLDSGLVALALICAQNIAKPFHRYTQALSDISAGMSGTQRLCDLTKMEREAVWTVPLGPPLDWPQRGEVKFINYESKASNNCTAALRGLNLTILKGQKIGVVSRERADTDGMVNSLYRVTEASRGALLIDGVNIGHVGLHDLRRRLQIISQVPVLFSGPLRANLDPFSRHTDAQVWLTLELCQLREQVRQLPAQLLHPVQRTAIALSLGQRRLLSLARALLAKVKILLVEEALPSVDLETEKLVQYLIRTEFTDCTVLWLSQNPLTLMHTDKLLVLNKGQEVKFDVTSALIRQGSLFS